jgi:hypothetical protein
MEPGDHYRHWNGTNWSRGIARHGVGAWDLAKGPRCSPQDVFDWREAADLPAPEAPDLPPPASLGLPRVKADPSLPGFYRLTDRGVRHWDGTAWSLAELSRTAVLGDYLALQDGPRELPGAASSVDWDERVSPPRALPPAFPRPDPRAHSVEAPQPVKKPKHPGFYKTEPHGNLHHWDGEAWSDIGLTPGNFTPEKLRTLEKAPRISTSLDFGERLLVPVPAEPAPTQCQTANPSESKPRAYSHYFKPLPSGTTHVDVYHVLRLFDVTDPCIAHAVKKLLVPGGRGAGKDAAQDVQEAIDSLKRYQELTSV